MFKYRWVFFIPIKEFLKWKCPFVDILKTHITIAYLLKSIFFKRQKLLKKITQKLFVYALEIVMDVSNLQFHAKNKHFLLVNSSNFYICLVTFVTLEIYAIYLEKLHHLHSTAEYGTVRYYSTY